jgi:hypothetical protein
MYVASITGTEFLVVSEADPSRSDMGYVGGGGGGGRRGPGGAAGGRGNGPQGLPLVKPPWGRITAIDLNKGDIAWTIPNGEAPDYIKNHRVMQGINLTTAERPSHSLGCISDRLARRTTTAGEPFLLKPWVMSRTRSYSSWSVIPRADGLGPSLSR